MKPAHQNIAKIRTDEESDAALHRIYRKEAEELPGKLAEHIDLFKAARASLDIATDLFRTDMAEFSEELPKHMEKLRQWRMACDREKDMSLRSLRDIRQFFLEDAHEKEMQRLSEFVRMCERLSALAKDGTLEKVADVMLKLA